MAIVSGPLSRLNPQVRKQMLWGWKPNQKKSHPSAPVDTAPAQQSVDSASQTLPTSPWDSLADAQVAGANRDYSVAGGNLDAAQNALGIDYGVKYGLTTDPTTGLQKIDPSTLSLDYSNPYSKASLLKKAYEQGQAYTKGSLASRGQLYSGYMQTKTEQGTGNFNQGNNALLNDFGSQAGGIYAKRYEAWRAAQDAPLNAMGDAISRHAGDPAPAPPTGQQILDRVGGTVVVRGKRRGIRRADGHIDWLDR